MAEVEAVWGLFVLRLRARGAPQPETLDPVVSWKEQRRGKRLRIAPEPQC